MDLRKLVVAAAVMVPLIYFGVAVVALMAVPVRADAGRAADRAWRHYIEDPVLGVVRLRAGWVADVMQVGRGR